MDQVTGLTYSVTGPNSVLVSWAPVTGATSYLVELRSSNQTLDSQTVTTPEVSFGSLVLGQLYEVLVTATDGVTTGERNRLVVYLAVNEWLSPVTDLTYTERETRDGVTVTWGASASATGYRLICETFGEEPQVVYDGAAASPFVVSGLVPETLYRFRVIPTNGGEEGLPTTVIGWIAPVVDEGRNAKTSHLLFPATTQGTYQLLYRPYQTNLRPLYADDRYWRFDDTVSYTNGPVALGQGFKDSKTIWFAKAEGNTITLFLGAKTSDDLPVEQESFTHTVDIKNVSLEFDQSGRSLVAFQDVNNDLWLRWYDPEVNNTVDKYIGNGFTPLLTSTRVHKHVLNTSDSSRLLFYVTPDHQVRFRKQTDRFAEELSLPTAPGDVLELLLVGKNLYGGMSVVACYMALDSTIETVTWTAFERAGAINIGTDRYSIDRLDVTYEAIINVLQIKAAKEILARDFGAVNYQAIPEQVGRLPPKETGSNNSGGISYTAVVDELSCLVLVRKITGADAANIGYSVAVNTLNTMLPITVSHKEMVSTSYTATVDILETTV